MAYRKKHKALILKQVPCILKYMACIFCLSKCLKNKNLQTRKIRLENRFFLQCFGIAKAAKKELFLYFPRKEEPARCGKEQHNSYGVHAPIHPECR